MIYLSLSTHTFDNCKKLYGQQIPRAVQIEPKATDRETVTMKWNRLAFYRESMFAFERQLKLRNNRLKYDPHRDYLLFIMAISNRCCQKHACCVFAITVLITLIYRDLTFLVHVLSKRSANWTRLTEVADSHERGYFLFYNFGLNVMVKIIWLIGSGILIWKNCLGMIQFLNLLTNELNQRMNFDNLNANSV